MLDHKYNKPCFPIVALINAVSGEIKGMKMATSTMPEMRKA